MFSNDAALQLGARLAAGTELQFLFADRFGLFENSREVFVYNSRMLEGATGGQLAQLQANIAAARTAGLQVVDIGSGFLTRSGRPSTCHSWRRTAPARSS